MHQLIILLDVDIFSRIESINSGCGGFEFPKSTTTQVFCNYVPLQENKIRSMLYYFEIQMKNIGQFSKICYKLQLNCQTQNYIKVKWY